MSTQNDAEKDGASPSLQEPAVPVGAHLEPDSEKQTSDDSSDASSSTGAEEKAVIEPEAAPPYSAFSKAQRNFLLTIVTVAGFFGPLSGGIYLPALPVLAVDFGVSDSAINATVSVFMVVFAVGPLFWAAASDLNGRRPLYILSFAVFIAANIMLAAVPANYGALLALRIVQAVGSCSVASMGAGTVADVTEPRQRASAMAIFLLGPQCGPILGPVLGGLFTGQASWRWIFGFLAIASFALWLVIVFCLPETLRSRVGNGALYGGRSWLLLPPTFSSALAPPAQRGPPPPRPTPAMFWRLFAYPPIGIVSTNTAVLFASFYCISISQPRVLSSLYGWSPTGVGLSYLASGIAMVLGSLSGGRFSDWRRARGVKSAPDGKVDPERRLADQIWGVLLSGAGTVMYGWLCQYRIHPAAVLFSTFLAGFGMTWVFVTSTSFLTECAPAQAASVFALGGLLRNPAAAVAAVVVQPLTERMGLGWCFTGLGLMDLLLVGAAVALLQVRSPAWRRKRDAAATAAAEAKKAKEAAGEREKGSEAEKE